ncbi:hypothetical protein AVEN_30523-1 [Araneus ventricosus]|uniref:Uncharacterized protein n=1 Tax=Araneus ventricosus TaxID=182803 RepID=A0A4Y2J7B7_ARAVE|nr:hypothetical protein AVEN_30523-1 [Araneus ventricosus]
MATEQTNLQDTGSDDIFVDNTFEVSGIFQRALDTEIELHGSIAFRVPLKQTRRNACPRKPSRCLRFDLRLAGVSKKRPYAFEQCSYASRLAADRRAPDSVSSVCPADNVLFLNSGFLTGRVHGVVVVWGWLHRLVRPVLLLEQFVARTVILLSRMLRQGGVYLCL